LPPRRIRYPILLALMLVLVLGLGSLLGGYFPQRVTVAHVPIQILRGVTGQRTRFELGLSQGVAQGLETRLTARCSNGTTWTATWLPVEGYPVHFVVSRYSFSTSEPWLHTYANGIAASARFVLDGRMTGRASAEGTVRLIARFHDGGESSSCDSRSVRWAVGSGASSRVAQGPASTVRTVAASTDS
jgi:hypothetical protein